MWNVQLCVDIMDSHLSVCVFYALFAVLFHWGEASRCIFWIPLMVLLCTDGIGLLLKLIFILFSLCQSRWHLQIAFFKYVEIVCPFCLIILSLFASSYHSDSSWRPKPPSFLLKLFLCVCIYNLFCQHLTRSCHHPVLVVKMLCWFWLLFDTDRKWLCLWYTYYIHDMDKPRPQWVRQFTQTNHYQPLNPLDNGSSVKEWRLVLTWLIDYLITEYKSTPSFIAESFLKQK